MELNITKQLLNQIIKIFVQKLKQENTFKVENN